MQPDSLFQSRIRSTACSVMYAGVHTSLATGLERFSATVAYHN